MTNAYDGNNLVSYRGVGLVTGFKRYPQNVFLALHWVRGNVEAFGSDVNSSFLPHLHFS